MSEKESVFRKQSIDSVASPEQLSDYIRSATPSVWFIMLAVIFLLIGVCIWGFFGRLETGVSAVAVCRGGTLTMLLPERYIGRVDTGMAMVVDEKEYTITTVTGSLVRSDDSYDELAMRNAGIKEGDPGMTATANAPLPDGVYSAYVTLGSVAPVSFIIN